MNKKIHSYRGHKNVNINTFDFRVIKTFINKIFWVKNIINEKYLKYILTIVNLGAK